MYVYSVSLREVTLTHAHASINGIIKVFRFQRKTLLFSYGTFFVIKVFRFQRKTLLLFFGFFFFVIIIISFSYSISPKRLDGFTWNFQG